AALLESEARLREADQRKDEFLAILAHELRNPLAPLSNALQLMRGHPPRARAAERLHEMMRRQVDHLVRLVDDLLETSRITRGVLELRKQRIEVASVVANAIETTEPLMQSAGHALTVSVPAQPLWLEGDPVRLSQILANLLNNAAKYTAPGGEIALRVEPREKVVRIGVRDNGRGIDAEALPRIFDMFRRNQRLGNGGEPGLGIGLALARRLAELHGGTLEAHSDGPGTGAEFVVLLPLAIDQVANGAIEPMAPADRLRMRVLIVDDNVDAAQSLAMVLEGFGAEVCIAHDGTEALRLFPEQRPVAVLLDIGMPGMDGYEVARRMRAQYPDNPAVLVALTGWGQEDDRRRAHEAGFNHHIIKPADIDALRELLLSLEQHRDGAGVDASA
ncbi:MAG: response regulator, partial [Betaproteobacteria bacterium]